MMAFFSKLSARERWLVLGAAVFVGSMFIFALIINPMMDKQRRYTRMAKDKALLAAMESNARKLGLADRIASMKPFTSELELGLVQSSVEMRVEKVDLKGLVEFIEAIETGPNMALTTRLRIKARFDDPALLDTTLLVTTLETR